MIGISNIELISDRPIETNLAEIREVKRRFPDRAVVVSLMVESKPEAWHDIVKRVNDTGADGIELNYGCPHGMAERGMGSAVGQVPEYLEMITGWAKEASEVPVLVKLTPNITDITVAARAAQQGGADGVALINTISSLVGLDLDTWETRPSVRGPGLARRLLRAGRQADRPQHGQRDRQGPARPHPDLRASAASRRGRTRSSSCSSAPPTSRSAPPSCTTATGSWRT